MLERILGGLPDSRYTEADLRRMEEIEDALAFSRFDSAAALEIGNRLAAKSGAYQGEICVQITRCRDNAVIFQYIADGKSERYLGFIRQKRNALLKTGRNSLWMLMQYLVCGNFAAELEGESDYLPVGGSFPVKVAGELVGTVDVSGLKNGDDFRLLVEVLGEYLGISGISVPFPVV